jgi:lipopolysaccharide/colanic/teichoic acid biosynthesis glycosyltransferase
MSDRTQRILDLAICFTVLPVVFVVLPLGLVLSWLDTKSPMFVQRRVGRGGVPFRMYKVRTMRKGTPSVGSHEVPSGVTSKIGQLLRRLKIDELPQIWNVLLGEMSFVGPRPCLPTQSEVIRERTRRNCFRVRPGITGAAQVAKVDMSDPEQLAYLDAMMIENLSIWSYIGFILKTATGGGQGDAAVRREEHSQRHAA